MTTMMQKEKEAPTTIHEVAMKMHDSQSPQEQIATYVFKLASATEERNEAV